MVELVGVTIAFGPLTVVEELSLRVGAGRLHCVAGRSGSGKTSVLRVAAGLVAPAAGEVLWEGRSLAGLSDDAITDLRGRFVGYLDQGGVLLSGLTALENVLMPAVPARRTRQLEPRARHLLAELGVAGRADHRPEQLSGGERHRVALARALLLEPRALVVDEPTASLDRSSADTVIESLLDLTREGIAVLVASHDQRLVDAAHERTHLE